MMMSTPIRQIQNMGPDDYEPPPTPCAGYRHKKFGNPKIRSRSHHNDDMSDEEPPVSKTDDEPKEQNTTTRVDPRVDPLSRTPEILSPQALSLQRPRPPAPAPLLPPPTTTVKNEETAGDSDIAVDSPPPNLPSPIRKFHGSGAFQTYRSTRTSGEHSSTLTCASSVTSGETRPHPHGHTRLTPPMSEVSIEPPHHQQGPPGQPPPHLVGGMRGIPTSIPLALQARGIMPHHIPPHHYPPSPFQLGVHHPHLLQAIAQQQFLHQQPRLAERRTLHGHDIRNILHSQGTTLEPVSNHSELSRMNRVPHSDSDRSPLLQFSSTSCLICQICNERFESSPARERHEINVHGSLQPFPHPTNTHHIGPSRNSPSVSPSVSSRSSMDGSFIGSSQAGSVTGSGRRKRKNTEEIPEWVKVENIEDFKRECELRCKNEDEVKYYTELRRKIKNRAAAMRSREKRVENTDQIKSEHMNLNEQSRMIDDEWNHWRTEKENSRKRVEEKLEERERWLGLKRARIYSQ